jgi:hypothetical protein
MTRLVPEAIKEIFEQAKTVQVKPVESNASVLFDRHGLEFEKAAIQAVMETKESKRLIHAL